MKYRWDKKYLYWGMTAFLVICLSICFYYFLFHGVKIHDGISRVTQISMPIIFGFIIAYLLTPILNFLEQKSWDLSLYLSLQNKTNPQD